MVRQSPVPNDMTSTRPAILLACDFSDRFKDLLRQRYNVLGPMQHSSREALPAGAETARALLTKGDLKTDRSLIEALPHLGLVAFFGTGFEGVDMHAARDRQIVVTHSPGANASSVADFAMGLVLASTRQIIQADRFVRDRRRAACAGAA